jgi:hypothetical protein
MQAALAAEEAKRSQAIERQAAEAGETRWVLSFKDTQAARAKVPMRVVQAGFAEIDGGGDDDSSEEESGFGAARTQVGGRKRFGKRKVQVGFGCYDTQIHEAFRTKQLTVLGPISVCRPIFLRLRSRFRRLRFRSRPRC